MDEREFIIKAETLEAIFEIIAHHVPTATGKRLERELMKVKQLEPPKDDETCTK